MKFSQNKKNWEAVFKLKPGNYYYKYFVDQEWVLNPKEEVELDINSIENHYVVIE